MGASSIALPAEGDGVEDLLEARVITNGGEIGIAEKVCGPLVAVAYGASSHSNALESSPVNA